MRELLEISKSMREVVTDNEVLQIVKDDLKIILAWFIIGYFQLNLDLISQARKSFRTQNDDKTILADKTDYVWNQEWSQFFSTYQMVSQL